jgi:aminoglycoside 6'-N-acetyltransferase
MPATLPALDDLLLLGERVTIRSYTRADADVQRLWPVFADPLLESYNLRLSPDGVDDYINHLQTRSDYVRFSIEDAAGELVGTLSLRELKPGVPRSRLGIVMRRDCCGRGIGTDALRAFLPHYFGGMGFHTLDLDVSVNNPRAAACYRKVGFRHVGRRWQEIDVTPDKVRLFADPGNLAKWIRIQDGRVHALHDDMVLTREELKV